MGAGATADHSEEPACAATAEEPAEAPAVPPGVAPAPVGASARGELSVLQANVLVAMFVGFWGRKGDGHPGPRLLTLGLGVLAQLVDHQQILSGRGPPGAPPGN